MSNAYNVEHFPLDYCQTDILNLVAAIQSSASLLAIGMPGCGKSRLIDFLIHRPGLREKYNLPESVRIITADGDLGVTGSQGIFIELLRALGSEADAFGDSNPDLLKNRLIAEVRKLETETDLVIIFDNFRQALQQTLGENFFNFLFALRNVRPKLNISYIFLANLEIKPDGFFKLGRLFDKGPDRSICWFTLLNRDDTFFSINRQLHRAGQPPDTLSQAQKVWIYELTGGHALLTRYLTLLTTGGDVDQQTDLAHIVQHAGIRAACDSIWHDLTPAHQNFVIDLTRGRRPTANDKPMLNVLQNYGLLDHQARFFSPVFETFVKLQEKPTGVVDIRCDELQTQVVVTIHNSEQSISLGGLSQRKRRLLCYLIENQGEPCPKDQLIAVGWPTDFEQGVTDQALSRQIDGIRSWLRNEKELSHYLAIETQWGEGYQSVVTG
ncbi:MAG: winged helix-turn-helix domain-containing protein [Anaerolineae bacterium]|nr:winged helix-turn-helix domain-containing protein [Anaerolineae bacterium]MCB0225564.1 winged helix-turn-helix domain-containing protein [Anaerolineae bacterium]MCB9079959.1 winged helix-turn-helix domain-containing protein [Anaerolineaceae bacterium]MCB9102296.1 winged helix-turn-helix domain-containing protein [Anaerolineales bacterium]